MKFKIYLIIMILISFSYAQKLKFGLSYPLLTYSPNYQKNFRESLFYGIGINTIILYQSDNETYYKLKLKFSGYEGIMEGDSFFNLSAGLKVGKPILPNFKMEAGIISNSFSIISIGAIEDNNIWTLSVEIIYQKWKKLFIGLENQYFLNSKTFDLKDALFLEIGFIF